MFDLTGKKALVTGASRGIGRGIALALAKQGADVAVNFHSNAEEAEKVVAEIKALGRDAFAVQADVSNKEQVGKMFEEIKTKWALRPGPRLSSAERPQGEGLNILVNNAGIAQWASFEAMTEEDWDRTLDTNLKGQFLCAKEAVVLMKASGGRIINISSIASGGVGIGGARIAHYVASKGGVVAMTEALAVELAPYKINVNSIAPGFIDTDMTKELITDEKVKQGLLARIPKGRFGMPADIAAAAAFLASDEADYITGTVLYVDGGWLTG